MCMWMGILIFGTVKFLFNLGGMMCAGWRLQFLSPSVKFKDQEEVHNYYITTVIYRMCETPVNYYKTDHVPCCYYDYTCNQKLIISL